MRTRQERISLSENKKTEPPMERGVDINIDTFLQIWQSTAHKYAPEVMEVVATVYGMVDTIQSLQETMQSSETVVDPTAELLSDSFIKQLNLLGSHALLRVVAKSLMPDVEYRDQVTMSMVENTIERTKANTPSNILKEMIGKSKKDGKDPLNEDGPYGLGTTQSFRDTRRS